MVDFASGAARLFGWGLGLRAVFDLLRHDASQELWRRRLRDLRDWRRGTEGVPDLYGAAMLERAHCTAPEACAVSGPRQNSNSAGGWLRWLARSSTMVVSRSDLLAEERLGGDMGGASRSQMVLAILRLG